MTDVYGIVANVISDRVLRTGAKVWIIRCNGDASCPLVVGLSKGGRRITKYTHFKRLENFRAKWIPEPFRWDPSNPGKSWAVIWEWTDRAVAESSAAMLAEMWAGVRSFDRLGNLLKDGITEEEAFRRMAQKRAAIRSYVN